MTCNNETSRAPLREELSRITTTLIGDRVGEQIEAVENLRHGYEHTITLVQEAIPGDPDTFRFNCFQYAFSLTDPPPGLVSLATLYDDMYPSLGFVAFLIDNVLTEVKADHVQSGDVVVYFDGNQIRHAGMVQGDQIVSKWGTAHTWKHGILEIPDTYGETTLFFRPISRDDALVSFLDFARLELGDSVFCKLFPELC